MGLIAKRVALAGVVLAAAIAPATAQGGANGANGADARCLAAFSLLHDSAAASDKGAFESGMMFFLGKIVGRGGVAGVSPAIEAGAAGVSAGNAASIADKCADEMTAASDAM